MTQIKISKSNACITGIEVSGHSGYSDEGSDIICAGISSVLWSTINGLENVLCISVEYMQKDDFVSCRIPKMTDEMREKAGILLRSMELYFYEIQRQYAGFVQIITD